MADIELKLTAGALPYSDGSGHQVTASVEKSSEGLRLRIEMVGDINAEEWCLARGVIDALVESAYKIEGART